MRTHHLLGLALTCFPLAVLACSGKLPDREIALDDPAPSSTPTTAASPSGAATAKSPTTKPATVRCDVSFEKDVLPTTKMCAGSACHGDAQRPFIDADDADRTYASLTAFRIGSKLYVDPSSTDPDDSKMLCNLRGEANCGAKMPLGGTLGDDQLDVITKWLACGAPQN